MVENERERKNQYYDPMFGDIIVDEFFLEIRYY